MLYKHQRKTISSCNKCLWWEGLGYLVEEAEVRLAQVAYSRVVVQYICVSCSRHRWGGESPLENPPD